MIKVRTSIRFVFLGGFSLLMLAGCQCIFGTRCDFGVLLAEQLAIKSTIAKGRSHMSEERYQEAARVFREALKAVHWSEQQFDVGELEREASAWLFMAHCLAGDEQSSPTSSEDCYALGQMLYRHFYFRQAQKLFDRAVALDAENSKARFLSQMCRYLCSETSIELDLATCMGTTLSDRKNERLELQRLFEEAQGFRADRKYAQAINSYQCLLVCLKWVLPTPDSEELALRARQGIVKANMLAK